MIQTQANIWIVSSDAALNAEISQLIQSNLNCTVQNLTTLKEVGEADISASPPVIFLIDSRDLDTTKQLQEIKGAHPNAELVALQVYADATSRPLHKLTNDYINLPYVRGQGNTLITFVKLLAEKQSGYSALLRLTDIATKISEAQSITEVMQISCIAAVDLFGVDHSGFVEFDDNQASGWAVAEYPEYGSTGTAIPVAGIPAEEQVVLKGEWFLSNDTAQDEQLGVIRDHLVSKGIRSILIMPVLVGNKVTASFSLDTINRKISFEDETITLCQALADMVGVAIKNIRRQEEVEYLRKAMNAVQQISSRSITGKVRDTLQAIVDLACKNLEADLATLYTYDEHQHRFRIGVGSGHSEGSMADPKNITEESTLYRLLNCDGFEKTEDAPNHLIFRGGFVDKENIQSTFGMKIMSDGHPVGVMFINFRKRHPKPKYFREEEINTYIEFGNQAAIIIRNAQLQQENRKRLNGLDGLYSVKGEHTPENLEQNLQRIADAALTVVGIDHSQNRGISHIEVLNGDFIDFLVASSEDVLLKLKDNIGRIDLNSSSGKIGIVGKAIQDNKTINVGDIKKDPEYQPYYIEYDPDVHSQLTVPLRVQGRVFGAISVESKSKNAFNEEEIKNLEMLARDAESILLNLQYFNFINSLIEAGERLTDAERLSDVMLDMGNRLRNLFGCDLVSMYTLSKMNRISYPAVFSGKRIHPEADADPQLMKSFPRRVAIEQLGPRSVLPLLQEVRDAVYCERDAVNHPVLGIGGFVRREKIQAAAAIPLVLKGNNKEPRTVGFLFLNYRNPHDFSTYERNAAKVFSQYLAYSIEYFQQYDELREARGWVGGMNAVEWMKSYSQKWQNLAGEKAIAIKSQANLLKQQFSRQLRGEPIDPEEGLRYARQINVLANEIQKQVTPSRSLSSSYSEKDCDLDKLLRDLVKSYKLQKDQEVKFSISTPRRKIFVKADWQWLWYGFENLFEYSIESMKESKTKLIEVDIVPLVNQVQVVIKDTGLRPAPCDIAVSSISRDEKEETFRVRWQTARAILELHEGKINCIDSIPGHTVFDLNFPIVLKDSGE